MWFIKYQTKLRGSRTEVKREIDEGGGKRNKAEPSSFSRPLPPSFPRLNPCLRNTNKNTPKRKPTCYAGYSLGSGSAVGEKAKNGVKHEKYRRAKRAERCPEEGEIPRLSSLHSPIFYYRPRRVFSPFPPMRSLVPG